MNRVQIAVFYDVFFNTIEKRVNDFIQENSRFHIVSITPSCTHDTLIVTVVYYDDGD